MIERMLRYPARSLASVAGLFALATLAGCGGPSDGATPVEVFPVKGSVQLESGKPLTGGRVVFVSTQDGRSASGPIGADGSFSLSSGDGVEGAPAGDYKVRIESPGASGAARGKLPFASKYLDEDASGLKASVQSGATTLEPFRLSSKEVAVAGRTRDRD